MNSTSTIAAPLITASAGLVGVVIGALISFGTTWWTHESQRRRSARFLCILVVGHFDRLTYECLAIAEDDGIVSDEMGMRFELTTTYPTFEPLSFDVEWKALDLDLAYEILQVPHRIERLKARAAEAYDPHDQDLYVRSRQRLFMEFGEQINLLSAKVRAEGKLPPDPEWQRKILDFAKVQKLYKHEEKMRYIRAAQFRASQANENAPD